MFNQNEFKILTDLVCHHGWKSMSVEEQAALKTQSPVAIQKFFRQVLRGWKSAQEVVIEKQLEICKIQDFAKTPLLVRKLRVLQRLMDTVVWTHLKMDIVDIRRFYGPDAKIQNLFEHNIISHFESAQEYNQNDDVFALVSDLTLGIQHGDLLLIGETGTNTTIVEIKEGEKNSAVVEAIRQKDAGLTQKYDELIKNPDMKKQLERTVRQHERGKNTIQILTTGQGKDFDLKAERRVFNNDITNRFFRRELAECADEAASKGHATRLIESCGELLIAFGSSKNTQVEVENLIKGRDQNSVKLFNLSSMFLNATQCPPLFLQPLSDEHKYEVIIGNMRIWLAFYPRDFISQFSTENFQLRMVEGKEACRMLADNRSVHPLNFNNSLLEYSDGKGVSAPLLEGLFIRVPAFQVTPSTLVDMMQVQLGKLREYRRRS